MATNLELTPAAAEMLHRYIMTDLTDKSWKIINAAGLGKAYKDTNEFEHEFDAANGRVNYIMVWKRDGDRKDEPVKVEPTPKQKEMLGKVMRTMLLVLRKIKGLPIGFVGEVDEAGVFVSTQPSWKK
jgi:hypothetical protein